MFESFALCCPDERLKSLDSATQEGVKLRGALQDTVEWLGSVRESLNKLEPVSCQKEKLTQQCRENEVGQNADSYSSMCC